MKKHFTKNKGFALLEVLIAIIVITTLITTMMIPGMTLNNYEKRKVTHQRMQTVQRALNQHLQTFGRLPCPVSPTNATTTNYTEVIANNICDNSVPKFNSGAVYYGAVPVVTLGLGQDYVQDGWGNKIMYVVPSQLIYKPSTTSPAQLTMMFYKKTNNSYTIPATTIVGGNLFYTNNTDFSNFLTTSYRANNINTTRNNQNLYVLLSYGENAYGAYSITGTQNSSSSASTANGEDQNIFTTAKANSIIFTNPSKTMKGGNLDDIVYETSVMDILNTGSSMQDSVYCDYNYTPYINSVAQSTPPANATLDAANGRFSTIQYYPPEAEVMISTECTAACTAGSTGFSKYIKCLSGGNWSGVYQHVCKC